MNPPGTQTQFLHYHSHHLHLLLTLCDDRIAFNLVGDIEKLTRTVQKSMRIIGVEEKCVFRFPLRLATEEISIFCVSFSRSSQPVPNGPHIQHNFTSNWNVQRVECERDRCLARDECIRRVCIVTNFTRIHRGTVRIYIEFIPSAFDVMEYSLNHCNIPERKKINKKSHEILLNDCVNVNGC